jgi:hypothetical protein
MASNPRLFQKTKKMGKDEAEMISLDPLTQVRVRNRRGEYETMNSARAGS